MNEYTPVDCGLYSTYELAILQRRPLKVSWKDDGGVTHMETLRPRDLLTRKGCEYLIATSPQGQRLELRLDRIVELTGLDPRDA